MTKKKEKIFNLPNFITLWRIPLAIVAICYLFANQRFMAMIVFALAGITDFLDGFFARKLKQETTFGKWFDFLADRIFVLLFVISLWIFFYNSSDALGLTLLVACFTRELLAIPAIIIRNLRNRSLYSVNYIGKLQTTFQIIALSALTGLPKIAIPLVLISAIWGIVAAGDYTLNSLR